MDDIRKIVQVLEDSNIFLKGIKQNKKKRWILRNVISYFKS